MTKPSPYRIFKKRPRGSVLVIQTRHITTGQAVDPGGLEAYQAVKAITSHWGCIRERSRLLLTPAAARFMLAAGSIEAMPQISPPDLGTGKAARGALRP